MNRVDALEEIVTFGLHRNEAFLELVNYPFDSELELIKINNEILITVLKKYISNLISSNELEEWANFIECRDDINYEEVEGYIYALANPELMGEVSTKSISKMLQILSTS